MALNENGRRLRAILDAFDVPISAVASASGVSRAYVSRVLSPNDALTGNDAFWLKIEKALGKLVDARRGQVFQIGSIAVEKVEGLKTAS